MLFEKIRAMCDEMNISIAELERRSKLSNGAIGKWKTVKPNLDSLETVAKALNTTVSELLKGIS